MIKRLKLTPMRIVLFLVVLALCPILIPIGLISWLVAWLVVGVLEWGCELADDRRARRQAKFDERWNAKLQADDERWKQKDRERWDKREITD